MNKFLTILFLCSSIGCSTNGFSKESETKCFVAANGKINCIDRKLYNEHWRH